MNRFLSFVADFIKPESVSLLSNLVTGNVKPAEFIKTFLASGTPEKILSEALRQLNLSNSLAPYSDKIGKISELLFAEVIILTAPADSPIAATAQSAITAWASGQPTPQAWVDYLNTLKTAFATASQQANAPVADNVPAA